MRRTTSMIGLAALVLLVAGHDSLAQRRGGGGGRGGGAPRPAAPRPAPQAAAPRAAPRAGPAAGPYSGAGVGTRSSGTTVGPAGGTRTHGTTSGSYTTQRGSTINYGGAGRTATTPGGVTAGRGVGGAQVTTPGGHTAGRVGTAGGVAGPGGNAAVSRSGVAAGTGPGGSFGSAYHGGVAVGPHGAAAAGGRVGTATGPGGTVSGATRGAAAAGPYGAAATRSAAVAGPYGAAAAGGAVARGASGTYYRSAAAVAGQGYAVRQNFRTFAQENPLLTARWLGPTYRPITWAALSGWAGYSAYAAQPMSYDYGETVVYSGDTVTINGLTEVPAEQYVQQAVDIATVGAEAKPDPKQGEWQQLGVFAMVGEGEEKSTNLFQLAINKQGVIAGEYYNALTDTTEPVYGSVDAKTQRAAWTVADRKFPVYEAGIANLTKDETTMLVHFSKEKAQQFTLVRIQKPEEVPPPEKK
ncbi:MAG TPA: hypothetical protein VFG68_13690 [Fimbriiglobus sp.]|nr:hypothetical protein [Fimbriiglobus sp.]